jgi:hypothetical protein
MDIVDLLRSVGLERYEPAFRAQEIDIDDLPELTETDLEKLGLPLGPRRRLLKAVAALRQAVPSGSGSRRLESACSWMQVIATP